MRRRAIALIELLISAVITIIIVGAAGAAYVSSIASERQLQSSQESQSNQVRIEQRLRTLVAAAFVSADENDASTYFIGQASGTSSTDNTFADTLTFTTLGEGVNGGVITSTDDFETLNQRFGPQGGVAEISLATTPVGIPPQDQQGLFMREQRPADGDPTQGGDESVLDPDIASIQFEFFDGNDWVPTWQTAQATSGVQSGTATNYGRRLPAAVRITYTLTSDSSDGSHQLVVRLTHSDVTTDNPATPGGNGQPGEDNGQGGGNP